MGRQSSVSSAPQPLDKLERTIAARAANPNEKSYTSQLLAGGVETIGAKIIEEAAEVVEAPPNRARRAANTSFAKWATWSTT